MNKKTIFNRQLYLEGLRQTKILGMISLVLSLIITVLVPTGMYLSESSYYQRHIKELSQNEAQDFIRTYTPSVMPVIESHIFYLLFVLMTLILLYSLFRFVNNREQSDFYHSIPHTRKCLYFSFSLSAFTWILGNIAAVTAVSALLYSVFSKHLLLNIGQLLVFAVNIFVLCLLIGSVTLLAQSLCGNAVATAVTFLIILFLPRMFLGIYEMILTGYIDYLTSNFIGIFNMTNNLMYALAAAIIYYPSDLYQEIFLTLNFSTLYTLALSLLLYGLGLYCFIHRKSETAGLSMNSPKLQSAFRTVFTLLICCIPVSIIFDWITRHNCPDTYYESDAMIVFWIVVSYIGALAAMVLYEFLTTKNIKAALKTLRTIPVLLAGNVIFFAILFGSYHYFLNLRLDAEKIDSVRIIEDDHYYYNDYWQDKISNLEFTNPEIISIFCQGFNQTADAYQKYLNGDNNNFYDYESYERQFFKIAFQGNHSYTFHFYLTNEEVEKLVDLYYESEEVKNIYYDFPELTDESSIYFECGDELDFYDFSDEKLKEIYSALQAEAKEIDFDTWYRLCSYSFRYDVNSNTDNYLGVLGIRIFVKNTYYRIEIPITTALPKTSKLILDYAESSILKRTDDYKDMMTNLNGYLNADSHTEDDHIFVYLKSSLQKQLDETFNMYTIDSDAFQFFMEHVKPVSEYDKETDIFLKVNMERAKFGYYYEYYVAMSEQDAKTLRAMCVTLIGGSLY